MLIDFTEYELETIANAMEDYINYDDEKLDTLNYYLVVYQYAERVNSIQDKIDSSSLIIKEINYHVKSLHHENILEDCFEVASGIFQN